MTQDTLFNPDVEESGDDFRHCTTADLVAMGELTEADLDELFAPWGDAVEAEELAMAA